MIKKIILNGNDCICKFALKEIYSGGWLTYIKYKSGEEYEYQYDKKHFRVKSKCSNGDTWEKVVLDDGSSVCIRYNKEKVNWRFYIGQTVWGKRC